MKKKIAKKPLRLLEYPFCAKNVVLTEQIWAWLCENKWEYRCPSAASLIRGIVEREMNTGKSRAAIKKEREKR